MMQYLDPLTGVNQLTQLLTQVLTQVWPRLASAIALAARLYDAVRRCRRQHSEVQV